MVKPNHMKKIILSLSIMVFIISCGPSRAELERRQKLQNAEDIETYIFYDTETNHEVIVHKAIIDGCEWYISCEDNVIVHNPHCTKTAE